MALVRNTAIFLRWRLIPVRMLGKLKHILARRAPPPAVEMAFDPASLSELRHRGYCSTKALDGGTLRKIQDIFLPRADQVKARERGHPFENVFGADDICADNPVFRLALSDQVLSAANAYFGGKFLMESIQVVRSFPTEGALRESQKWHKDYGDSKSLHFIMYLNPVKSDEDGPFVFIDKSESRAVKRYPFIRRLTDQAINAETGNIAYRKFHGDAGDAIIVDPAACYHFGSRCRNPRTAVFVTFSSFTPYVPMTEPIQSHRRRASIEARKVRPDLPGEFIDAILRV